MFKKEDLNLLKEKERKLKSESASRLLSLQDETFEVLVIGGGTSGMSAAYHLTQSLSRNHSFPSSLLVVDKGELGAGANDRTVLPPSSVDPVVSKNEERFVHTGRSGGVVYSAPHFSNGPAIVKMSVQLYPSTSRQFILQNGEEGARRYLRLAALGIELQKMLIRKTVPSNQIENVLEEDGSLLLADKEHENDLLEEYELLKLLGCASSMEWWDQKKVEEMHGIQAGFVAGIFFPADARVDALSYVRALAEATKTASQTKITFVERCPPVVNIIDCSSASPSSSSEETITVFENGAKIRSKWIVLATNGLFLPPQLAGILTPCWSYFLALPHPRDPLTHAPHPRSHWIEKGWDSSFPLSPSSSPNFFTYGFTHDWCITQGVYRISGEDHYSALKPPRAAERCMRMADWSVEKYPSLKKMCPSSLPPPSDERNPREVLKGRYLYGVYAETPDSLPLIGMAHPQSRICYLVGCNAWGQASMSYAASLVPSLLGYAPWTEEQKKIFEAVSISRFNLRPFYLSSQL